MQSQGHRLTPRSSWKCTSGKSNFSHFHFPLCCFLQISFRISAFHNIMHDDDVYIRYVQWEEMRWWKRLLHPHVEITARCESWAVSYFCVDVCTKQLHYIENLCKFATIYHRRRNLCVVCGKKRLGAFFTAKSAHTSCGESGREWESEHQIVSELLFSCKTRRVPQRLVSCDFSPSSSQCRQERCCGFYAMRCLAFRHFCSLPR